MNYNYHFIIIIVVDLGTKSLTYKSSPGKNATSNTNPRNVLLTTNQLCFITPLTRGASLRTYQPVLSSHSPSARSCFTLKLCSRTFPSLSQVLAGFCQGVVSINHYCALPLLLFTIHLNCKISTSCNPHIKCYSIV